MNQVSLSLQQVKALAHLFGHRAISPNEVTLTRYYAKPNPPTDDHVKVTCTDGTEITAEYAISLDGDITEVS